MKTIKWLILLIVVLPICVHAQGAYGRIIVRGEGIALEKLCLVKIQEESHISSHGSWETPIGEDGSYRIMVEELGFYRLTIIYHRGGEQESMRTEPIRIYIYPDAELFNFHLMPIETPEGEIIYKILQ